MRETIRCCIACILPCGALDVVRIVHANGRVEEISHAVKASDVMQQHPKHVLRKPPSTSTFEESGDGGGAKASAAVILPPTAELKRGKIYFLMPVSSTSSAYAETKSVRGQTRRRRRRKRREVDGRGQGPHGHGRGSGNVSDTAGLLLSDRYLTEILSEKSTERDRRRGRVGVWRPHLESISEDDL